MIWHIVPSLLWRIYAYFVRFTNLELFYQYILTQKKKQYNRVEGTPLYL